MPAVQPLERTAADASLLETSAPGCTVAQAAQAAGKSVRRAGGGKPSGRGPLGAMKRELEG